MKTSEKAKELIRKYKGFEMLNECIASKQCALIAVDEILEATKQIRRTYNTTNHGSMEISGYYYSDFWLEVKSEIEALLQP